MQENFLKKSLAFVALVTGLLLLLFILPSFSLGSWKFKKINLLADIQKDPVKKLMVKSETEAVKAKPVSNIPEKKDLCPKGITCLEDFSENHQSLSKFFKALRNVQNHPVRIAFFGDSFIEGDILCANFRDTLQRIFGGRGVGYVPITSEVAQYRTTIQHTFSGWKTYSIVGAKDPSAPPGTAGYCFIPQEGNEVIYKPSKKRGNEPFNVIRLFFENPSHGVLKYVVNDSLAFSANLPASDSLQQLILPERNIQSIKLQLNPYDSMKVYGTSFESGPGIYVDNFSMRGNSGIGLYQIEPKQHRAFNRFRDYKLILLQYGLNVVSETDSAGYGWYVESMTRVVTRIQESFPNASIVLLSVSDRGSNQDGTFATMPNIPVMRDAQREIARKCHISFWDLFNAMGGENSIIKYVSATPPLAAKDYTHLTYWGGRKIAKKLADAVLTEQKKYAGKK
jgi:hypothetical protein